MLTDPGVSADSSATLRRASLAATVGSAIEYYEFTAYGFLAVVFAPLFFPTDNPAAATLSALAIFGGVTWRGPWAALSSEPWETAWVGSLCSW